MIGRHAVIGTISSHREKISHRENISDWFHLQSLVFHSTYCTVFCVEEQLLLKKYALVPFPDIGTISTYR